MISEGTDKIFW